MEEGDDELWDVLIRLSIVDPSEYQRLVYMYLLIIVLLYFPEFVTGLLNSVGTHINPTQLIKVSTCMTIPNVCMYRSIMFTETETE